MARIRIEQLLSNLAYDTGSSALTVSGSLTIIDALGIASASFNTSGSINVDIIDGGTY